MGAFNQLYKVQDHALLVLQGLFTKSEVPGPASCKYHGFDTCKMARGNHVMSITAERNIYIF
jgi:hypothetical protein